jgi:gas vesicle protein
VGRYLKGMAIGGALGMTAAAVGISIIEPRIGRVLKRHGRQAARMTKKKINHLM